MNKKQAKIGVSPALLISMYGNQYTPENVCEAMELITSWGFSNIQIEIFDKEKIPLWLEEGGAKKVRKVQEKLGINISQLVCHLLIDECTSRSSLLSDTHVDIMKEVVQIGKELNCCDSITLPIGSFINDVDNKIIDQTIIEDLRKDLVNKIRCLFEPVREASYKLAVELLPFNIAGGYSRFSKICDNISPGRLGFLFDTGHAWVGKEDVVAIPNQFKGKIFGTHLCDNFGDKNMKLAPGKGSIPWKNVIQNLKSSMYPGFYDLEIICVPEKVEEIYRLSFEYISSLLTKK